jgi:hypothetical protein
MGLDRLNIYLHHFNISACFVDTHEDYNCFGEAIIFVVPNVAKWNKEPRLSSKTATELFEMLKRASGEECLPRTIVFKWHTRFKEGLST